MICNLANTIEVGNPIRIFDANGLEWDGVIECDTETGRIVRYVKNEEGRFVEGEAGSRYEGELIREEIYTAAPLLVVSKKGS